MRMSTRLLLMLPMLFWGCLMGFRAGAELRDAPDVVVSDDAAARIPDQGAGKENFTLHGDVKDPECVHCHGWRKPELTPRDLKKPHEAFQLRHGAATLWCHDCHHGQDVDYLLLPKGVKVGYGDAHRSCAVCHGARVRDWSRGGHGKRIGSWRGPRIIKRCSACHDAHDPAWKPVTPYSLPRQTPR